MIRLSVITATLDGSGLGDTVSSLCNAARFACGGGQVFDLQVVLVAPKRPAADSLAPPGAGTLPVTFEWVADAGEGISAAFNAGLQRAKGTTVAILNAGDLWFEHTIARVCEAAERYPNAILHSAITFETATGQRYQVASNPLGLSRRMTLFHPALFVPATVYQAVGHYDTSYRLAMDSAWCHRAVSLGVAFQRVEPSLAIMRLGGRSDTSYVAALGEFRRSVVASGLSSPLAAAWHFWRYRCQKAVTHRPPVRWLLARLRSVAG